MFTDRSKAVLLLWIFYVISVLFFLCFRALLFINTLWSPAGKGLTSWLSFVMPNCEVVTFPMVPWVRCCACLYRFLIFALFLTLKSHFWSKTIRFCHYLRNVIMEFITSLENLLTTSGTCVAGRYFTPRRDVIR